MATLPWYPRDMGKYARDTKHLTMLEHGAYNLLLDCYYSSGTIQPKHSPSSAKGMLKQNQSNLDLLLDHSRIYRICGAATKDEQNAVDNVISYFFEADKDGIYRHKKADEVIETQTAKHLAKVEAGRKGGSKHSSSKAKAQPKRSSSNKTKTKNNPPTPHEGEEFDVLKYLTQTGRDAVKRNAPSWCIDELARVYNQGIASGQRNKPNKPNEAFPAWCLNYTKGKPPQ